eukprot:3380498-Pyramimonas_sp.AAC.1
MFSTSVVLSPHRPPVSVERSAERPSPLRGRFGSSLNLRLAPPHVQFGEGTFRVGHCSRYFQLLESARADHLHVPVPRSI